MPALLIYALVLYGAVLLSGLAQRTPASVPALCLLTGALVGRGGFGWVDWTASTPAVEHIAELTLVSVLYTDGMRLGLGELRSAWRLPGRALLLGLPVTLLAIAALAAWLLGLELLPALLLAAVLTPTDPVLAAPIVGRREVPKRLRRLLNVESGINDGLALPIVLLLIGVLGSEHHETSALLAEVAGGVALGLALPWLAKKLRPRRLNIAETKRPLYALAVWLMTMALALALGVNEFLASFVAGMSLATVDRELRDAFHPAAEQASEVLKLAALLVFGALITPQLLGSLAWPAYAFALATLVLARPVGIALALCGSALGWRERAVAAWFGPKGFASLVYAILVLRSEVPDAPWLYHVAALVIALSIVVHSSSDVLAVRWLQRTRASGKGADDASG